MPYVEGYGTWPFGEEWLWEAMATSYLPLLDVLEAAPELTLSLTPVLCDQLAAPGVGERFAAFLRDVRPETHRRDIADAGDPAVAAELERSAALYAHAGERFGALGGDLLAALAPHAAWTSSATHAVLPLLATDAGVRLQVRTGVESHRARFAAARPWRGGFWSPECAHGAWLDPLLEQEGVHATCVDLTDVLGFGAVEHLRPLRSPAGPLLVPIDRSVVELVWHPDGYPAKAPYRDSHHKTEYEHKPWRNDGAVYDPRPRSARRAPTRRTSSGASSGASPAAGCACARSTPELLGHWWAEGIAWLGFVVEACRERGVPLVHLDDALEEIEPVDEPAGGLPVTTWGRGRDLSTWERAVGRRPRVRHARRGAAHRRPRRRREHRRRPRVAGATGERLGLRRQRGIRGALRRERAAGHLAELEAALGGDATRVARGIAPRATPAALLAP
jgi:1,4-alpha-glucan branching enzyme